ncbi:serine hydrolase [Pseudemcibacter aquimaris]|uniref:serine hydrolase n=1 Tax=Pseudemcibacter aquimaris TaxID=2857064 RepID=UPI0020132AA1|nr:serine hydrolase [Pseudemcibacter aquimaris]MCC3861234.1 serine hydrolase [Pseudemcibacter aquimaris]WDU58009.1 serine hydrolase [Pseudemcibacter aquimaris]
MIKNTCLSLALLLSASTSLAADMPISENEIDEIAERALETFETPGMSVGILKDGELIFAKGYGIADVETGAKITPDTVFGIASHTKAYTVGALAMLKDQGKLDWDDKVIDHIPEFRLYDPYATREFTIRDLLTHRSGLDLGAGDLLMFPNSTASRADIINALQHLKPVSSFRSKYDYDNLLYIVAGEVVTRVSGQPWEEYIEEHIFKPLNMTSCRSMRERLPSDAPSAAPHIPVDGKITKTYWQSGEPMTAAGSINCSLNDHAKWIALQLNEGKMKDGTALYSEDRHKEIWSPVTMMRGSAIKRGEFDEHFSAYGLGWILSDAGGELRVRHTGGLVGMVTYTNLLPEQEMAVMVFTNSMNGGPMVSVSHEILDAYLGLDNGDWITAFKEYQQEARKRAEEVMAKAAPKSSGGTPSQPTDNYVGTYHDAWYGDIEVRLNGDNLEIAFGRSELLTGPLEYFQNNTFIARWYDRTLEADAYVTFETSPEGNINGIKMKPVSPLTDFSFDFQHLDPKRVQ